MPMVNTCSHLTITRGSELAGLHNGYFSIVISQNTSYCPKCLCGMQDSPVFLHTQNMGVLDGKHILKIHLESNKKLLETELQQDLQRYMRMKV